MQNVNPQNGVEGRMGELISGATVQWEELGVCADGADASAGPAASRGEDNTAQEERLEQRSWQHSLPLAAL